MWANSSQDTLDQRYVDEGRGPTLWTNNLSCQQLYPSSFLTVASFRNMCLTLSGECSGLFRVNLGCFKLQCLMKDSCSQVCTGPIYCLLALLFPFLRENAYLLSKQCQHMSNLNIFQRIWESLQLSYCINTIV